MKKRISIVESLKAIPDIEEQNLPEQYHDAAPIWDTYCEKHNWKSMHKKCPYCTAEKAAIYLDESQETDAVLNESRNWDKFTKDIVKREREAIIDSKEKRIDEDSPQREYNKRYREDWRNSTRWKK